MEKGEPMDLKAKFVELIEKSLIAHVGKSCKLAENIAGDLIANGVRLESEQATSDKASDWISVKDRLPQEDEPLGVICKQVQILLSDGFVTTGWYNRAHRVWFYLPYEQTKFIGHDYKKTPVIAWQPLAQPPKGE
jgi:hypothetical protein